MKVLDPRVRVVLGLLLFFLVLGTEHMWAIGLELVCFWVSMFVGGILRPWIRSLRVAGPMVAMVFFVGVFAFGLEEALEMAFRFLTLLTASFILFASLSPHELAWALRKMGVPRVFSFILVTAMRYVPLLTRRFRAVVDAQRSRGIDLRPKVTNLRNLLAPVTPFLVQSFQLAEDLALAMEARGFSRKTRTTRKDGTVPLWQYGLVVVFSGLVALIWWGA